MKDNPIKEINKIKNPKAESAVVSIISSGLRSRLITVSPARVIMGIRSVVPAISSFFMVVVV
jgi:hypothetical protein